MTREEAIEVYNGLINEKIKAAFEFFVPELRKSEDERVRHALIEFLREAYSRGNAPEECAKWIVWLDQPKEQKPAEWSERENGILIASIQALEESGNWVLANKLKSIRMQPKVEWSDEDKAILGLIQDAVDKFGFDNAQTYYAVSDFIKSLCPSLKPNDEQAVEGKIVFLLNGDVAINIGDTDKYKLGDKVRLIILPKED